MLERNWWPVMVIALLLLVACTGPDSTIEGAKEMENTYGIASSAQLVYNTHLRIAAGNIWREEYVDEQGVTRTGPTAALWIGLDGSAPQVTAVRVHVGQILTAGPYTIRVVEIGQERGSAFVRVQITEGTPAP